MPWTTTQRRKAKGEIAKGSRTECYSGKEVRPRVPPKYSSLFVHFIIISFSPAALQSSVCCRASFPSFLFLSPSYISATTALTPLAIVSTSVSFFNMVPPAVSIIIPPSESVRHAPWRILPFHVRHHTSADSLLLNHPVFPRAPPGGILPFSPIWKVVALAYYGSFADRYTQLIHPSIYPATPDPATLQSWNCGTAPVILPQGSFWYRSDRSGHHFEHLSLLLSSLAPPFSSLDPLSGSLYPSTAELITLDLVRFLFPNRTRLCLALS
ncbi:hypothetical protein SODALDRAFT_33273 [Sodiomyces alkalinus F11]|uniref:Uncharacterized protein n=1 Tax=Sodiomyces alkalinus (strain CBS 110278 / VKM F-3762 / F11) TaxID=1314773 RepID=A0A3N2Q924_SODAK|nr:hypothetical protein SODALDRAFT_33273 [Sodiomyces alkalinus F11]ROT43197.1 hypothetical protein SODALDRAFT_33273 [Sodiomyces alkalinus F11]